MSWVLTIAGICALVIVHEFGHFAVAKALGMRVERFSLFFPPRLAGFRRGETEYMLGAIPAGGYVKISGMSPHERDRLDLRIAHRAYYVQAPWRRIAVIIAGPAMNLLVAFAILWGVYTLTAQHVADRRPRIAAVQAGRPATGALRARDVIVAVDGRTLPAHANSVETANQIAAAINAHRCRGAVVAGCAAQTPVALTVRRGSRRLALTITPRYDAAARRMLVGFQFGGLLRRDSPGEAAGEGVRQMWRVASVTVSKIGQIFTSESARKQLHGIVGVSDVTSQAFTLGIAEALYVLALLSLSLAIVNLFPFLPLDGGHIFYALVEKLRGRAIPFSVMERASVVGFVLVGSLFLIGLTNDIHALSNGGLTLSH
jgi:regulator of sigma E protease